MILTHRYNLSRFSLLTTHVISAYLAYSNKRRAALKRLYPDATNAELSKMLSKAWREADPAIKAEYIEEEARLRAEYNIAMMPWRSKKIQKRRAPQSGKKNSKKGRRASAERVSLTPAEEAATLESLGLGSEFRGVAAGVLLPDRNSDGGTPSQRSSDQIPRQAVSLSNSSISLGRGAYSADILDQAQPVGAPSAMEVLLDNQSERSLGGIQQDPNSQVLRLLQGGGTVVPLSNLSMYGYGTGASYQGLGDLDLLQQLRAAQPQVQSPMFLTTDLATLRQMQNQSYFINGGGLSQGLQQYVMAPSSGLAQYALGSSNYSAPMSLSGGTQDLAELLRQQRYLNDADDEGEL